jgi:mono/diheme cytochrome c family protein
MRSIHWMLGAALLLTAACDKDKPAPAPAASASTPAPAATSAAAAPTPSPAVTASAPATAAASGSGSAAPSASAVAAVIPAEATKIYNERCVLCHGKDGKGNPPTAAGMKPVPRNFTDAAWQGAAKDEDIKLVILKGGGAIKKSPTMPPNPDLESKPDVVEGLKNIVRGFKG